MCFQYLKTFHHFFSSPRINTRKHLSPVDSWPLRHFHFFALGKEHPRRMRLLPRREGV